MMAASRSIVLKEAMTKALPSAIDVEEIVLGTLLIDGDAFPKVAKQLKVESFHSLHHQVIYRLCERCWEKMKPIDLVTVYDELQQFEREKKNRPLLKRLGEKIDPMYLTQLTNRIASSANVEYHAAIIHKQFLLREAILVCHNRIEELYHPGANPFEIRNDLADALRVRSPKSLLKLETFNESIEQGRNMPEAKKIAGTLFNVGEVCIFFGSPGTGKSIFSIQLADALSRGVNVMGDILVNDAGRKRVLYIDFELTDRDIFSRYSNENGEVHEFDSEYLMRAKISEDFDFKMGMSLAAKIQMEEFILAHKPDIMIIDNITWLTSESSHDSNVAIGLMRDLISYKLKYGLSLFIVAHTTKELSPYTPLEDRHLAGSKHLQNFTNAIVGVKRSATDSNLMYIKQFKDRGEPMIYTDNNVLTVEIVKGGTNFNFLQYKFNSFDNEKVHLAIQEGDEESMNDVYRQACQIKVDSGASWRNIMKEVGYKKSHQTFINKVRKWAEQSNEFEFVGKHVRVKKPFHEDVESEEL